MEKRYFLTKKNPKLLLNFDLNILKQDKIASITKESVNQGRFNLKTNETLLAAMFLNLSLMPSSSKRDYNQN